MSIHQSSVPVTGVQMTRRQRAMRAGEKTPGQQKDTRGEYIARCMVFILLPPDNSVLKRGCLFSFFLFFFLLFFIDLIPDTHVLKRHGQWKH